MADFFKNDPYFQPGTGNGGWLSAEESDPEEDPAPIEVPDEQGPEEVPEEPESEEEEEEQQEEDEAMDIWDEFGEFDPMGSDEEESELGDGEVIDDPDMLRERDLPTGANVPVYQDGVGGPLWTPSNRRRIPVMRPFPSMHPVRVTPYTFQPKPYSTFEVGQSSGTANAGSCSGPPPQPLAHHNSERLDHVEIQGANLQKQMEDIRAYSKEANNRIGKLESNRDFEWRSLHNLRKETEHLGQQAEDYEQFRRITSRDVQFLRARMTSMEDQTRSLTGRVQELEDPGSPVEEEEPDSSPSAPK